MREVLFSDFLAPDGDAETLQANTSYTTAGILSYGRGLFVRPPVQGQEVTYKRYFRLHRGMFVYSRLFAWEGALAVVGADFDGLFVSPEFPTFTVDRRLADPEYVALLCRWPVLWSLIRGTETGMGGRRKRVYPEALLAVRVPLPSLAEQRRIVDLIGAVDEVADALQMEVTASRTALVAFLDDVLMGLDGETMSVAQTLSESIGGDWGAGPGEGEVDVPVYRQTEFTDLGVLTQPADAVRSLSRRRVESRLLRPGDVLLQKSAGTPTLPGRVVRCPSGIEEAVFSNFLTRLRVNSERAVPTFVFWHLWHDHQIGVALDFQAGTNIRNLDLKRYLARMVVVPSIDRQRSISDAADAIHAVLLKADDASARLASLRASLLSDLLSGSHGLPATYDRFLNDAA